MLPVEKRNHFYQVVIPVSYDNDRPRKVSPFGEQCQESLGITKCFIMKIKALLLKTELMAGIIE